MANSPDARFASDEDANNLDQLQAQQGRDLLEGAVNESGGKLNVDLNNLNLPNVPGEIIDDVRAAIVELLGNDHEEVLETRYQQMLQERNLTIVKASDTEALQKREDVLYESAYEVYGKAFGSSKVLFALLQHPKYAEHKAIIDASLEEPISTAADISADLSASLSLILYKPNSEQLLREAIGASSEPQVVKAMKRFNAANVDAKKAEKAETMFTSKETPITTANKIEVPDNVDELKILVKDLEGLYGEPSILDLETEIEGNQVQVKALTSKCKIIEGALEKSGPDPKKEGDLANHQKSIAKLEREIKKLEAKLETAKKIKSKERNCLEGLKNFYEQIKEVKRLIPAEFSLLQPHMTGYLQIDSIKITETGERELLPVLQSFTNDALIWLDMTYYGANDEFNGRRHGEIVGLALKPKAFQFRSTANTAKTNLDSVQKRFHREQSLTPEKFANKCFERYIDGHDTLKHLDPDAKAKLIDLARKDAASLAKIGDPKNYLRRLGTSLASILADGPKKKRLKQMLSAKFDVAGKEQDPFKDVTLRTLRSTEKIGKALDSGDMRCGAAVMTYRALQENGAQHTDEAEYLKYRLVEDIKTNDNMDHSKAEEEFKKRVNWAKDTYTQIDALDKSSRFLTNGSGILERNLKNTLESEDIRNGDQTFFGTLSKTYQERWKHKPGALNATVNIGTMAWATLRHPLSKYVAPAATKVGNAAKNKTKRGLIKTARAGLHAVGKAAVHSGRAVKHVGKFGVASGAAGLKATKNTLLYPVKNPLKTATSPLRLVRHPIDSVKGAAGAVGEAAEATKERWRNTKGNTGKVEFQKKEITFKDPDGRIAREKKLKRAKEGLEAVKKYHHEKDRVNLDSVPDWFNRHVT